MAAKLEELNLTTEELNRFQSAFQDPRFLELFSQYAKEIRDPENRRRYEREITEMERERGIDVLFIHPFAGHVLQTSQAGGQRCCLNICYNELVSRSHCVPGTDRQGRPGQHWSLPCALSPPREDLVPGGGREILYDVIFHPDILRLAAKNRKFKAMVNQTALDTVARSFRVVLDTRSVRTLREKYRGLPQPTVVRKPRPAAQPKPHDPSDPLKFPYPYDVPGASKKPPKDDPKASDVQMGPHQPTIPTYTIRHRSYVDIQDYRDARDAVPSPVPKELVLTVDLPLLTSSAGVTLDIEGKELTLESQKPFYWLRLKLPYLVQEELGSAQFNKIKRQMVITLPVVQPNAPKAVLDLPEESDLPSEPTGALGGQEIDTKEPTVAGDAPELPVFTCSQDATTVTLVLHVKDVDEHSITSELSCYQCEIRFCAQPSNTPHVLFVEFLPQYQLNTNDIAVRVSKDNAVIELTKSCECFGLWKNLYFGVDTNSLQERRFVNEDNVAMFLESSARPSAIPWSTRVDPPLISVLEMNNEGARIRLEKPDLEEERCRVEQCGHLSDVKKKINYDCDSAGSEDSLDLAPTTPDSPSVDSARPTNPPEDSSAEDQGLSLREIDEDDLPDGAAEEPVLLSWEPSSVLKEVGTEDGDVDVPSDHRTQWAFQFENAFLFDLD